MSPEYRKLPADEPWDSKRDPQGQPPGAPADKKLQAAIRKTLEQAAREERPESPASSALDVVIEVARRHPTVEAVDDPHVAADLVCELGKYALPGQIFQGTIQRISPDIAAALLADPIASQHLGKAWLSARSAAGLTRR